MSEPIYQQDKIQLISDRITEEKHPLYGDMTVFNDVVIASEMVQKYGDGKALKHRDELEQYAWTVEGRWIIAGGHPEDAIISDRSQVSGRTVNPRYVRNLKDPKTGRPNRAGVLADVQVFNSKIPKTLLDEMRAGKKADVSIGFFFTKDAKAGAIEDGPFKGDAYDYVQRNMFHDHLAVGIDNGRCPSPYCGLGADAIKDMLSNDPFSGFEKWSDCLSKIGKENPDLPKSAIEGICGKLKAKHEKKDMEDSEMGKLINELARQLLDELEAVKGEREANKDSKGFPEWWRSVDWKEAEYKTIFDHLSPDVKKLITDAGECPECRKDNVDACVKKLMAEHPDWPEERCRTECVATEGNGELDKKGSDKPKEEDVKTKLTPEEQKMGNEGTRTPEELKAIEEERKRKEEELKKLLPKSDALDPLEVLKRAERVMKVV